jgi:hypothetical protein
VSTDGPAGFGALHLGPFQSGPHTLLNPNAFLLGQTRHQGDYDIAEALSIHSFVRLRHRMERALPQAISRASRIMDGAFRPA